MWIGVLGAGQLGRMLALAGIPLGFRFRFLDPGHDAPAAQLGELVAGRYDETDAIERFLPGLDRVTFEFENVPAETLERISARVPVAPCARSLQVAQDREYERHLFGELGVPAPASRPVESEGDLHEAARHAGLPAILKTRRLGYDGRGQYRIREAGDLQHAWEAMRGQPLLYDAMIPFTREVSLIAVRAGDGTVEFYDPVENVHRDGILRESCVLPRAAVPELFFMASNAVRRIAERLGHVGVITVEFFEHGGVLLANEIAPRVHNSGHWTIEGAVISQFENHLRAVAGHPLGATETLAPAVMLNLIGGAPDAAAVLAIPGAHLHLYGKEPRRGRKVGHITIVDKDAGRLEAKVQSLRRLVAASEDG